MIVYNTRSGRDQPVVPADLFDRYFAEIHRYITRRLPADDADDLAAEASLAALRGGYDPAVGEIRPWLCGIATNLVARHRRTETTRWKALSRAAERDRDGREDPALNRVLDRVDAARFTAPLAGAPAALKQRDRDVVLLIALGGLSHAEVASALNIPYGTVASRLNRARKHLRAALGALKEDIDG
ncbi:RNA polymerase sigma factor [Nonomuraea sp. NPDC052129]|uniref:RNA polymerase sigma factor n=1 Tax=Nonomuraea sp. NPDC052129 TaxID=3154651 RepID=UPI00341F5E59